MLTPVEAPVGGQDPGQWNNGEWRLENNNEMKMKMGEKTDNAGRS